MRATNSMDGVKRINKRVTHRLAGYDIVNILCLKYREHDTEDDGELPDLPASKILKTVDDQLKMNADAPNWWADDVDDDDWAEELDQWARDLVRLRFPELY